MSRHHALPLLAVLFLGACTTSPQWGGGGMWGAPSAPPAPPPVASAPPAPGIASEDLVGRWGFASYHREADRVRTTNQARQHCRNAYEIARGDGGGVLMHLPDQREPSELRTKGAPDGRRYVGPDGPAGDALDREFVSFDGRTMVLRWVDPEVAKRYGTSVYVRCGPRVAAPRR